MTDSKLYALSHARADRSSRRREGCLIPAALGAPPAGKGRKEKCARGLRSRPPARERSAAAAAGREARATSRRRRAAVPRTPCAARILSPHRGPAPACLRGSPLPPFSAALSAPRFPFAARGRCTFANWLFPAFRKNNGGPLGPDLSVGRTSLIRRRPCVPCSLRGALFPIGGAKFPARRPFRFSFAAIARRGLSF